MVNKKNTAVKKPVNTAKNKPVDKKKDQRIFIYAILIAILTIIVFSNSIRNNFVKNFDDIIYTTTAANTK